MNKIWIPLALTGLLALPLVACETQDGDSDTTTTTTTNTTTTDTSVGDTDTITGTQYFAILVQDRWKRTNSQTGVTHDCPTTAANCCATSSVGAHGADIDAVALFDDNSDLIGYFDVSDGEPADADFCDSWAYNDTNEAEGAPDGTLTENFYSLYGGWLIGEFTGQPQILAGYELQVFEIGVADGGQDEGYAVSVATELDCPNQGSNLTGCDAVLISNTAEGEQVFNLSGF